MDEQVDLMDRKNIPITPGLHISTDISDEEENNSSRSRSSSRIRSPISNLAPQISHPHSMSTGSGQSSLSTLPNHILTSAFQLRFYLQLILRFLLLLSPFHPLVILHQLIQRAPLRLRFSLQDPLLPPTPLVLPIHGLLNPDLAQVLMSIYHHPRRIPTSL